MQYAIITDSNFGFNIAVSSSSIPKLTAHNTVRTTIINYSTSATYTCSAGATNSAFCICTGYAATSTYGDAQEFSSISTRDIMPIDTCILLVNESTRPPKPVHTSRSYADGRNTFQDDARHLLGKA
jgi:hypothetical protein